MWELIGSVVSPWWGADQPKPATKSIAQKQMKKTIHTEGRESIANILIWIVPDSMMPIPLDCYSRVSKNEVNIRATTFPCYQYAVHQKLLNLLWIFLKRRSERLFLITLIRLVYFVMLSRSSYSSLTVLLGDRYLCQTAKVAEDEADIAAHCAGLDARDDGAPRRSTPALKHALNRRYILAVGHRTRRVATSAPQHRPFAASKMAAVPSSSSR